MHDDDLDYKKQIWNSSAFRCVTVILFCNVTGCILMMMGFSSLFINCSAGSILASVDCVFFWGGLHNLS